MGYTPKKKPSLPIKKQRKKALGEPIKHPKLKRHTPKHKGMVARTAEIRRKRKKFAGEEALVGGVLIPPRASLWKKRSK